MPALGKEIPVKIPAYKLLKIGTDTEIFLRDKVTNLSVPVIGLLGGTKEEPLAVPELGEGFAIQEDNVMPEFNVPAAASAEQFTGDIVKMLDYLTKKFDAQGLKLDISPSCLFTKRQLDHPQAQRIGCEGDYCVWTRRENVNPKDAPELARMRSAGGHIHVSFLVDGKVPDDILQVEEIVKGLDSTLGVMSVLLDKDTRRKKLYGQSGAFRPKPYGIEYRTLSNFWITKPEYMTWVFKTIQGVFDYLSYCRKNNRTPWWTHHGNTINDLINKQDAATAEMYIHSKRMEMPLLG